MQIKLRRASLAEPSERISAATRLIANIFQRTDLVRRHCNSPLDGPRTVAAIPPSLPSQTPLGPHPRSSRHSIHIGHALGGGFVQSIFSSPPRRPPFTCFPSVSRRVAELKILCIMCTVWLCDPTRLPCASNSPSLHELSTAHNCGDFLCI